MGWRPLSLIFPSCKGRGRFAKRLEVKLSSCIGLRLLFVFKPVVGNKVEFLVVRLRGAFWSWTPKFNIDEELRFVLRHLFDSSELSSFTLSFCDGMTIPGLLKPPILLPVVATVVALAVVDFDVVAVVVSFNGATLEAGCNGGLYLYPKGPMRGEIPCEA